MRSWLSALALTVVVMALGLAVSALIYVVFETWGAVPGLVVFAVVCATAVWAEERYLGR